MSQKVGEIAVEVFFFFFFPGLWPLFCESVWPSGIDKCVTSDNAEQEGLIQADISWTIWKGGFGIELNVTLRTIDSELDCSGEDLFPVNLCFS